MQDNNIKLDERSGFSLKKIGNNLSFFMKKEGVNVQRLSDKTGVGIATIKNIKRGCGNPTISTLYLLADYFKVTLGVFIDINTVDLIPQCQGNIVTMPLIRFSEIEKYAFSDFSCVNYYTAEVESKNDSSLFAFEVTNNAFVPEIDNSSICIVSMEQEYVDSDIVLIKVKGYPIFLRRAFIGEHGLFFCNFSLYSDIEPVQYSDYTIIGVLQKIIKRLK